MPQADNQVKIKAAAITALAENFGRTMSVDLARMWLSMLKPYSGEEVQRACLHVIAEYEFKTLPPFAVLKKALNLSRGTIDPEQAKRLKAEAEWTQLREDIQRLGPYDGPRANMHPTTAYVLRGMGGWDAACDWLTADMVWRQKDFVDAWVRSDGHTALMEGGATAIEQATEPDELGAQGRMHTLLSGIKKLEA